MWKFIMIVCLIPLMASRCLQDTEPCKYSRVTFQNQSADTIIYAYKYAKNGLCYLDGWKIAPQAEYMSDPPVCNETIDPGTKILEIFIADPALFINHQLVPCDSIFQKYPVWKNYNLSENELRRADFKIRYP